LKKMKRGGPKGEGEAVGARNIGSVRGWESAAHLTDHRTAIIDVPCEERERSKNE